MIRGPYRSYSSDFKIFIVANGLRNIPSHKSIPRSTIHYWRHHSVGRASRNDMDSFGGPSESKHVAMTTQVEIQREIARSLCKTLAELTKAGKFDFTDLNEIWSGLRRGLDDEFTEELRDLLPRSIRDHLLGPICTRDYAGYLKSPL